jgi:hypothetical protein
MGGGANGCGVAVGSVVDVGIAASIEIVGTIPSVTLLVLCILAVLLAVPIAEAVFLTFVLLAIQRDLRRLLGASCGEHDCRKNAQTNPL